ncbi:hypothetical protein MOC16_gp117 [Klebsiella phage vB_KpM_FBKp24]|uniref:Uncharacterized protein n=1 Tax=Klebsiella phage vB_KpM_FBKp24 TaxID=2801834 RepID=A0A7U0GBM2_9CAUD|nr:hypothetical protein MOC16_gp117 [Klebsiella phage vB_KpM_FBKp24]QQV92238.1 hypothetical protein vBKpMFBKp24_296 [Klebsiella phage vB_KpM_FBKp24]
MTHRTILKFNTEEETFEVTDKNGRPVDPLDLSETLETVNTQIGFELYKPDVADKSVDGEDLTVVSVTENDSGAVTEALIEAGSDSFNALLADNDWYLEETDPDLLDEEDLDDFDEDDEDDDYQSGPEDFEDDE